MNTINEIQVSYSHNLPVREPIGNAEEAFQKALKIWNLNTIELYEEFKVIYLNKANHIIGHYSLFKGGIDQCTVDVRLLLSIGLCCNATGLIVFHNHPSGNISPSRADKEITKNILDACKLLQLNFIDHIIVTKENYFSFMNEGLLA